jgi:hypothetical protein
MVRFVSKIEGVTLEYDRSEGRERVLQTCHCSLCSATMEIVTKSRPFPSEVIFKKMRRAGWAPNFYGKHKCKSCVLAEIAAKRGQAKKPEPEDVEAQKPKPKMGGIREAIPVTIRGVTYPTMNAAAKALGVPTSTMHYAIKKGTIDDIKSHKVVIDGVEYPSKAQAARDLNLSIKKIRKRVAAQEDTATTPKKETPVEITKPAAPTVVPPRTMTREERRKIWRYLDEVYDVPNTRYLDDLTDHKVAEALKVPRAWVSEIRDEAFGPDGGNASMEKLHRDMLRLSENLTKAVETCLNAATEAEKFQGELKSLENRLAQLRSCVGPQVHKI